MENCVEIENCVKNGNGTPEGIQKAAKEALAILLSSKSKDRYDAEYDIFEKWIWEKGMNEINETVLLAYFGEILAISRI